MDLVNSIDRTSGIAYHPDVTLQDVQKVYVMGALRHYNGNKKRAAEALGITVKTLYNKLNDYGLPRSYPRQMLRPLDIA